MADKMTKSVVLAVETSGRVGSVAAGIGDDILAKIAFSGAMRHSAELFPATEQILAQIGRKIADVGQIRIASGPGSFTGLRIAVSMAKMMNFAIGARIVAANTMDVIAANATECVKQTGAEITRIGTILDAKRGEFFIAVFERTGDTWTKTTTDRLMKAPEFVEQFADCQSPVWLLGEGLVYYKDAFSAEGVRFLDEKYWPCRAEGVYAVGKAMAKASKFADPASLVPFYLRQPDAKEKFKGPAKAG